MGAGEPPRTRGASPGTCAGHNLASSLGGHYDPVLPPRPHRVRPGTPGLHPPCIPFCLSVRHSSSAQCLLLGELGLNPSRKHLARGGRGAADGTQLLALKERVTGENLTHRTPWLHSWACRQLPQRDFNSRQRTVGPSPSFLRTRPRLIGNPRRTRCDMPAVSWAGPPAQSSLPSTDRPGPWP